MKNFSLKLTSFFAKIVVKKKQCLKAAYVVYLKEIGYSLEANLEVGRRKDKNRESTTIPTFINRRGYGMQKYYLMHKNRIIGSLDYDETTGRIADYHDEKTGFSPFLGSADISKMKKWWEMRAIPSSRETIADLIKRGGCLNAGSYLAKNLALSMTDSYWICPVELEVSFDRIKLFNLEAYSNGRVPYHNATSYDPNASLGGQMEKYWDVSDEPPVLVKESYKNFGQQAVNEVFASKLHEMQQTDIPFVKYRAEKTEDRGIICRCEAFTSEDVELISAYEVVESKKRRNDIPMCDHYINVCVDHGIDREQIQKFMDYQTLTDFILTNTDEHLNNFGVLRNANTMELIGPAPIYDSGNSMFYADKAKSAYSRADILRQKVSAFYSSEEKMLRCVKNKDVVKEDLLPDRDMLMQLYTAADIPEWKVSVIADNYETKRQMLKEFQHGLTISLYHEKQREKENVLETPDSRKQNIERPSKPVFIMFCGIAGSGKTKKAAEMGHIWKEEGQKYIPSSDLYSLKQALQDTTMIMDREKVEASLLPGCQKDAYTQVSANDIRKELNERGIADNNLVFFIADIRIKQALQNGISVLYDASNLDKFTRKYYAHLAEESGAVERKLYILYADPHSVVSDLPTEKIKQMDVRLRRSTPGVDEGWTEVVQLENLSQTPEEDREYSDMYEEPWG